MIRKHEPFSRHDCWLYEQPNAISEACMHVTTLYAYCAFPGAISTTTVLRANLNVRTDN